MYNPLKGIQTQVLIAALTETPDGYETGWRSLPCTVLCYLHSPGGGSDAAVKIFSRPGRPDVVIPATGALVTIPAHERHRMVTTGNGAWSAWMHFNAVCDPGLELTELFELPRVRTGGKTVRAVLPMLRSIIGWWGSNQSADAVRAQFTGAAVVAGLLEGARMKREPGSSALLRLTPALQALRNTPERRFSNAELAELCFLSESRFRTLFRETLGKTPHGFAESERLQAAIRHLRQGLSLEVVAEELGYCDASHFSRVFRRAAGISPGKYRESIYTERESHET